MLSICGHERSTTLIDPAVSLSNFGISVVTPRTTLMFELGAYYQASGVDRCSAQITQLELLAKGYDLAALLRGYVSEFEYDLPVHREHKAIEDSWT